MWSFEPDRDDADRTLSPERGERSGGAGARPDRTNRSLQRYRGNHRFYERYWVRIFGITQADVAHLVQAIRVLGEARDLTAMVKDVIQARLEQGPQVTSGPAPDDQMPGRTVRHWDPGAMWSEGDRVIVPVASREHPDRAYAPRVGEALRVGESYVVVKVDGVAAPQVYGLGIRTGTASGAAAEAEMATLAERTDMASQVDDVVWRFGPCAVSQLLHALEADGRFVELEGRWFLRELAERPRETEMAALARAMFRDSSEPKGIAELLALMPSFRGDSTAARFGLFLELMERRDLFGRVGRSSHASWRLISPPPMRFVAQQAVYDPGTYEILCVPGDTLSRETAGQLWGAGLLYEALGPDEAGSTGEVNAAASSEAMPVKDAPGTRDSVEAGARRTPEPDSSEGETRPDARRSWLRRLPFWPH